MFLLGLRGVFNQRSLGRVFFLKARYSWRVGWVEVTKGWLRVPVNPFTLGFASSGKRLCNVDPHQAIRNLALSEAGLAFGRPCTFHW